MLHSLPDFSHFLHYPQSNWAPLVLIPGRVGLYTFRTLWVSPVNSPVRLGVSPAAASTPTGVFNQRFEALFSCAGAPDCAICFDPLPSLLVYLCMNVSCRICQPPPSGVCQLQPGPSRSTICHLTGSATHHLATSPLHPAARLHPSYRSR